MDINYNIIIHKYLEHIYNIYSTNNEYLLNLKTLNLKHQKLISDIFLKDSSKVNFSYNFQKFYKTDFDYIFSSNLKAYDNNNNNNNKETNKTINQCFELFITFKYINQFKSLLDFNKLSYIFRKLESNIDMFNIENNSNTSITNKICFAPYRHIISEIYKYESLMFNNGDIKNSSINNFIKLVFQNELKLDYKQFNECYLEKFLNDIENQFCMLDQMFSNSINFIHFLEYMILLIINTHIHDYENKQENKNYIKIRLIKFTIFLILCYSIFLFNIINNTSKLSSNEDINYELYNIDLTTVVIKILGYLVNVLNQCYIFSFSKDEKINNSIELINILLGFIKFNNIISHINKIDFPETVLSIINTTLRIIYYNNLNSKDKLNYNIFELNAKTNINDFFENKLLNNFLSNCNFDNANCNSIHINELKLIKLIQHIMLCYHIQPSSNMYSKMLNIPNTLFKIKDAQKLKNSKNNNYKNSYYDELKKIEKLEDILNLVSSEEVAYKNINMNLSEYLIYNLFLFENAYSLIHLKLNVNDTSSLDVLNTNNKYYEISNLLIYPHFIYDNVFQILLGIIDQYTLFNMVNENLLLSNDSNTYTNTCVLENILIDFLRVDSNNKILLYYLFKVYYENNNYNKCKSLFEVIYTNKDEYLNLIDNYEVKDVNNDNNDNNLKTDRTIENNSLFQTKLNNFKKSLNKSKYNDSNNLNNKLNNNVINCHPTNIIELNYKFEYLSLVFLMYINILMQENNVLKALEIAIINLERIKLLNNISQNFKDKYEELTNRSYYILGYCFSKLGDEMLSNEEQKEYYSISLSCYSYCFSETFRKETNIMNINKSDLDENDKIDINNNKYIIKEDIYSVYFISYIKQLFELQFYNKALEMIEYLELHILNLYDTSNKSFKDLLIENINMFNYDISHLYIIKALCMLNNHLYDKAEQLLDESLEIVSNNNNKNLYLKNLLCLYKLKNYLIVRNNIQLILQSDSYDVDLLESEYLSETNHANNTLINKEDNKVKEKKNLVNVKKLTEEITNILIKVNNIIDDNIDAINNKITLLNNSKINETASESKEYNTINIIENGFNTESKDKFNCIDNKIKYLQFNKDILIKNKLEYLKDYLLINFNEVINLRLIKNFNLDDILIENNDNIELLSDNNKKEYYFIDEFYVKLLFNNVLKTINTSCISVEDISKNSNYECLYLVRLYVFLIYCNIVNILDCTIRRMY